MYAIAFDLKIDELKKEYGDPYNGAYDEIRRELESVGFRWTQGSVYVDEKQENSLTTVYKAINKFILWHSYDMPSCFNEPDFADVTGYFRLV